MLVRVRWSLPCARVGANGVRGEAQCLWSDADASTGLLGSAGFKPERRVRVVIVPWRSTGGILEHGSSARLSTCDLLEVLQQRSRDLNARANFSCCTSTGWWCHRVNFKYAPDFSVCVFDIHWELSYLLPAAMLSRWFSNPSSGAQWYYRWKCRKTFYYRRFKLHGLKTQSLINTLKCLYVRAQEQLILD